MRPDWALPLVFVVAGVVLVVALGAMVQRQTSARAARTPLHSHAVHWSTGDVTYVQGETFVTSTREGRLRAHGTLDYATPPMPDHLVLHLVDARTGARDTRDLRLDSPTHGTYTSEGETGTFQLIQPG